MSALLPAEAALLEQLEVKIERGFATFTEVGRALTTIRDNRLYRETHRTFATYLDERWGISRARGYQFIEAASVVDAVSTRVDIAVPVSNEKVARELAKADDPVDVWETVRELNGDKPTATQVRAVVQERQQLKNPASDKQVAYLRSIGGQVDGPISSRTASKKIDELKAHRICTCATCGQHWDRETRRGL